MKIENIKFRGKSKRTGEWLYGDLEYNRKKDIARIHSYDDEGGYIGQQEVDKESIGQFTGLYDESGKAVFEWDLLSDYDNVIEVVWHDAGFCYCNTNNIMPLRYLDVEDRKVIGNIYDNKELLTQEYERID